MFHHRYRFLFVLALAVYTYLNTEFCGLYEAFGITLDGYYALATILLITLMVMETNRILEPQIRRYLPPEANPIRFPILFFLVGTALGSVITIGVVLFMGMVLHPYSLEQNIIPLKLNLTYAGLLNLLFHLIHTVAYYFQEYRSTRSKAEELERFNAQAELQLIRNQINPHFLFNNLNVLSTLVMQNNSEANRFIEEFSKVYRYILTHHEKELVELKTELRFIAPYLFLLEKRFGEGLQVRMDIPEQAGERLIIPAALQMLIENAIKHNVVSRSRPLQITLTLDEGQNLVVANNLQVKQSVEPSTHIGLSNIIRRYGLVCRQPVTVDRGNDAFRVSLPLLTSN